MINWQKAYLDGRPVLVRPYIAPAWMCIESTIPELWVVVFADGRTTIMRSEQIDFD